MSSSSPINVEFAGTESDRFVRFAKHLLEKAVDPTVKIEGRESITSLDLKLTGELQSSVFDGYKRVITIKTDDNILYKIGGNNSTKPICGYRIVFQDIPQKYILDLDKSDLMWSSILDTIKKGTTAPRIIIHNIRSFLDIEQPTESQQEQLLDWLTKFNEETAPQLLQDLVGVYALLPFDKALGELLKFAEHSDGEVRKEFALRMRGVVTRIKEINPELANRCAKSLIFLTSQDDNPHVRTYAAESLGYIFSPNAVNTLVKAIKNDTNIDTRWAAVVALGRQNSQNNQKIVQYLMRTAGDENEDIAVRQGALLGLSRRSNEATLSGSAIEELLQNLLLNGPEPLKPFAAHGIGQLEQISPDSYSALVGTLNENCPIDLLSNSTLSLGNCSNRIDSTFAREISTALNKLYSIEFSFCEPHMLWFLENSAQLAALIENHKLAHKFYQKASKAFSNTRWKSQYLLAQSNYEFAEHIIEDNQFSTAIEKLGMAINILQKLQDSGTKSDVPREAVKSIHFRIIMIKARRDFLQGIECWNSSHTQNELITAIGHFDNAYNQYLFIGDKTATPDGTKRLVSREMFLVKTLRRLSTLGKTLIKVRLGIEKQDLSGAQMLLGKVENESDELAKESSFTGMYSISKIVDSLLESIAKIESLPEGNIIKMSKAILEICKGAQLAISAPLALPAAVCPIVKFGEAQTSIWVPGSLDPTNGKDSEYLFPINKILIIEAEVQVERRTQNDKLIVRYNAYRKKPMEHEVPVKEGAYSLQFDLGEIKASHVPIAYDFETVFRSKACEQIVSTQKLWIKGVSPEEKNKS